MENKMNSFIDLNDFLEPKKRRFHPLRGLRKIFRRKSRGPADVRLVSAPGTIGNGERDSSELARIPREDVTIRHPAGRAEEARSRSASELLTDTCDHEGSKRSSISSITSIGLSSRSYRLVTPVKPRRSFKHVFLRRNGTEDSFVKLRGGTGKLSVSHDSVFPGEVPNTRPLSSLDSLPALERRQERKSNEIEHKDYAPYVVQRHRISLRVLEQIKTVIENRNQQQQQSSTISSDNSNNTLQQTAGERYQQETTENHFGNYDKPDRGANDESHIKVTKPAKENVERTVSTVKEDLPQFESASLNHTAALHRISVRPKNRRPPRRAPSTINKTATSTITTIVEDTMDDLDQPKSPKNIISSSSPIESKKNVIPSVTRKPSARTSRNSDVFEGLESPQLQPQSQQQQQQQQQPQQPQQQPQLRLPKKPSSIASLSPDSLDPPNVSRTTNIESSDEQVDIRSIARRSSNRISKGSDVFEELESKLPRRRLSSSRSSKSPDSLEASSFLFSKSTDGFENLIEYEETTKPLVSRRLLNPISKSTDRISKSSDSLEAIEALTSDDSIERRRSSFEFRGRRTSKSISKSSESFEILDQCHNGSDMIQKELQKRSSISDMNLSTGRRLSKGTSKSTESFERIDTCEYKNVEHYKKEDDEEEEEREEEGKILRRRTNKRMSSESSDNLDVDDRLENRRVRRIPKRVPSTSIIDIVPTDNNKDERRSIRKSRLQKSSESSELGSTDTLDSERRNKSSESTETLDSLEKDVEQDRKEMEITDNVLDRRDKNDSWSSRSMTTDSDQTSMADGTEDSKSLISPDKFYWRQSSDTKENIDIHQLLAITIVTRMADNGNNQRSPVIYPKKKQQITTSPPTSPVAKQEDNKMIFDNLLTSKNDEDLQNMLNGNISEVSTDTKSFKEKLIMFEKLGK
ncbi:TNF receptor-associated factor family protein DDB_G0272098-like isoform X6 [Vespa velutina]|uniref:TNF receptor-associated factor family protein DDB_G0272098-like isoform X6 n=1 Tax=Vespa velutina TaxID=202808 RepID=UPI001FB1D3E6|nr:TNF receptor-associated factor family protein DDB_G0272098-like isoform X6 [Vespa velutina]